MPHIIVKLYPGRSESEKQELTRKIVENVIEVTGCKERSVSLAIQEIEPGDWTQKVYEPDIMNGQATLYKEPGYDPFASQEEDKKEEKKSLMDHVRAAARIAEKEDTSGFFNPMSWLDLQLEDHPESFDAFFESPWKELSDKERQKRAVEIRRVL
ncbi:tautomerase family protein [Desulfospira joergensenii]|uniref:tautomerase family protein n=1 Tax=Desulfospira joergensenii TaxID=53329 RepID=UPI00040E1019|nr:tautomerase family protein [Desulfospira joergensenii]